VFFDGALVYDYTQKAQLASDAMTIVEFLPIIDQCYSLAYMYFEWEDKLYATKYIEPAIFSSQYRYPRSKIIIAENPPEKFHRVYFRWFSAAHKQDGMSLLKALNVHSAMIEMKSEYWSYINHRNEKLKAYMCLEEQRVVDPKQTLFFGNGENDAALLKYIKWGVCMKDSHPSAVTNSRYVLSNPGNAGILEAVDDLISLCSTPNNKTQLRASQ
jgi:hydroxymethylpyrimidine pyrophosphatase-like HAD family hydrolase